MVLKLTELRRIAQFGAERPWHLRVLRDDKGDVKPLGDGSPTGELFGQAVAYRDALVRIGEALDARLAEIEADPDLTATGRHKAATKAAADALAAARQIATNAGALRSRVADLRAAIAGKLTPTKLSDGEASLASVLLRDLPWSDPLQLEQSYLAALQGGHAATVAAIESASRDFGRGLKAETIAKHQAARLDLLAARDPALAAYRDGADAEAEIEALAAQIATEAHAVATAAAPPPEPPPRRSVDAPTGTPRVAGGISFSDGRRQGADGRIA